MISNWGFRIIPLSCQLEESCMGFNNKLGTLHKIIEFYTEFFSVCPNITSTFFTVNMFKSFVEENNDPNKICRHVHGLLLYQT
jgi:hypothetical protein